MFSLQKLFGKDDRFFTLLEASAEEARTSVQALVKLSKHLDQPTVVDDLTLSRRKDKQITQQINEALHSTFVTPIDREDIQALAYSLYRIPKTTEKFIERARLSPQLVRGVDFSNQISLMERATEVIVEMIRSLRHGVNLDEVRDLNDRLQHLEGEADKAILELYRDLYSGKHDAVKVIVLKDLYELLEKVIDRCRDAGTTISHVALKHS
jgi:hypothetical protein